MKFWVFHIILAVTLCAKCSFAKSQSNDWRSYLEQLAEEGMDDTTIENMFQELTMLEGNPMNLNRVSREQLEQFEENIRAQMRRDRPLKREGTVEDVAEAALYFVGERSRYVTGTVLPIDGGTVAGKVIVSSKT